MIATALMLMLAAQADSLRVPLASTGALAIRSVEVPAAAKRYAMMEVRVDLQATYQNPFHPAEIELTGSFRGPGDQDIEVPGFFYQDFTRKLENETEVLAKKGDPIWLIRFTPPSPGKWRVKLTALDRSQRVESTDYKFEVADSWSGTGFVRIPKKDATYFQDVKAVPFFGVGLDIAWAGPRGTFEIEEWFAKLAANGGNLVRVWSCPWSMGLEWNEKGDKGHGTYYGLGKYSLDNAWLLDRVIQAAEKNGIKVILCLGTYGELKTDKGMWNEEAWTANPYNSALGGPAAKPDDFYTDVKARAFYRQRLHYVVARYSYSPAILAWELWNEVPAPTYWVHEMAEELKTLDPYNHLVTTSYGSPDIWKDEFVDIVNAHPYGDGTNTDLVERIAKDTAADVAAYKKPRLTTEFGISYKGPDTEFDKSGTAINLRSGLWAAAATGSAAGAMNWWWDNYVAKLDLWHVYKPFADAVKRVDWTKAPMKPAVFEGAPDDVVPLGVVSDRAGFIWLRRKTYNWKDWKGTEPQTPPFQLRLTGVKGGGWTSVWWDTSAGKETAKREVDARGALTVDVPPFGSDIALLLTRK